MKALGVFFVVWLVFAAGPASSELTEPPYDAYLVVECEGRIFSGANSRPTVGCAYKVFEDFGNLYGFSEVVYGDYTTVFSARPYNDTSAPLVNETAKDEPWTIPMVPDGREHFLDCAWPDAFATVTGTGVLSDSWGYAYPSSARQDTAQGLVAKHSTCAKEDDVHTFLWNFQAYSSFQCTGGITWYQTLYDLINESNAEWWTWRDDSQNCNYLPAY